jgi:hypothetical protein
MCWSRVADVYTVIITFTAFCLVNCLEGKVGWGMKSAEGGCRYENQSVITYCSLCMHFREVIRISSAQLTV